MKTLSNTRIGNHSTTTLTEQAERFVTSISGGVKSAAGWIANELATRRAIAELQSLDDYMLKDIGLTRSSIEGIVKGKIDEAYGHGKR